MAEGSGKPKKQVRLAKVDSLDEDTPTSPRRSSKPVKLVVYTLDSDDQQGVPVECTSETGGLRTTAGTIKKAVLFKLGIGEEYLNMFSLWMTSPYLSIQLKETHMPCRLYRKWEDLLAEYTTVDYDILGTDKPLLSLRRSAFLTLKEERKIKDKEVIKYLYKEALFNVINDRYPMSKEELLELAGIQANIVKYGEDPQSLDAHYFRNKTGEYLPPHILPTKKSTLTKLLRRTSLSATLEEELMEKYREINSKLFPSSPSSTPPPLVDVMHYYLQRCRSKSFYGSVFFNGQIAKKMNLAKMIMPTGLQDRPIVMAINMEGIHIMEDCHPREVLIKLTYEQMSLWELLQPKEEEEDSFFSCLHIEWKAKDVVQGQEEAATVTKQLPIFSRQAAMMDAMISNCVNSIAQKERQLTKERKGKQAPIYNWETSGPKLPTEGNPKEKKLVCTILTEDGKCLKEAPENYVKFGRSISNQKEAKQEVTSL